MTPHTGSSSKPLVVITGSDGLIGSAFVRKLHLKYDVVGLDNDRKTDIEGLHDLIYCDLTSADSVREAFQTLQHRHGSHIASFIHLAAYYDFTGKDSPLYEELTVQGTRKILERLQEFDVEQFVFSSTLLVMKPSDDGQPIDESAPLQPEWAYPKSKVETEKLIDRMRGEIPAAILRIGGVYDDWGRAVPIVQQIKRIYEKDFESYFFPGDSDHGQAMVHLDDLAVFVEKLIEKRNEIDGFQPYLIGEPDVMSYEELQDQIGELIHREEWPSIRIPKPIAKLGAIAMNTFGSDDEDFIQPWMVDLADQDYRVDITKARSLSWEPRHSLRDTLPVIVGNLLENPDEWSRKNGLADLERQEAS